MNIISLIGMMGNSSPRSLDQPVKVSITLARGSRLRSTSVNTPERLSTSCLLAKCLQAVNMHREVGEPHLATTWHQGISSIATMVSPILCISGKSSRKQGLAGSTPASFFLGKGKNQPLPVLPQLIVDNSICAVFGRCATRPAFLAAVTLPTRRKGDRRYLHHDWMDTPEWYHPQRHHYSHWLADDGPAAR